MPGCANIIQGESNENQKEEEIGFRKKIEFSDLN